MTTPNFSLADLKPATNTEAPLLQDGDAAVIIRPDGSTRIVTVGFADLPPDSAHWNDKQWEMFDTGQKALALLMALGNEQIMSILMDMLNDPNVIDPIKLQQMGRTN